MPKSGSSETQTDGDRIVIVGAGHAGGCAAFALRSAGFRGSVVLVGTEDHPPYERPPLSKELLAGTYNVEKTYLRSVSAYQDLGVELELTSTVTSIERNRSEIAFDSRPPLHYDKLLLTTGARARVLPLDQDIAANVHYLRTIADTMRLKERLRSGTRLLIVGAGFIGLEIAATAALLGCAVTVLESQSYPLARVLPKCVATIFSELHASHGVVIHVDTMLSSIRRDNGGFIVETQTGQQHFADEIVIGVGSQPNVELAQAAGLDVDDGVVVDEYGKTSDPCIFAAGDATRHFSRLLGRYIRLETWQNAQKQSERVAQNMIGPMEKYAEVPWVWTNQYTLNFQLAGFPLEWGNVIWRGAPGEKGSIAFALGKAQEVVAGACFNNPRDMRFVRQLIASQIPVDVEALRNKQQQLAELTKERSQVAVLSKVRA